MRQLKHPVIERAKSFIIERAMLLVTVVLCVLFLKLNLNLNPKFKQVNDSYANGSAINLNQGVEAERLADLLLLDNYVSDPRDAAFIATQIVEKLNSPKAESLPNLYELNKSSFQVPASLADSLGGEMIRERVSRSYQSLRVDAITIAKQSENLPDLVSIGKGNGRIIVSVMEQDTTAGPIKRMLDRNTKPVDGVLVQLKEHWYDSLKVAQDSILGYAKTNGGVVRFEGLDTARYYSVIPISKGFEYGAARGTTGGNLGSESKGVREFSFIQRTHTIRLLNDSTYRQIRDDESLTVRTPGDFRKALFKWLAFFFVAWWGLYLILKVRRAPFSKGIIAMLMLLTGFCLLTMFSIHNPLTDKMLGVDMAQGIIVGVVAMAILQWVDFERFFQDGYAIKFDFVLQLVRWFFVPFSQKVAPIRERLKLCQDSSPTKFFLRLGIVLSTPLLILDLFQITRLGNFVKKIMARLPKGFGYLLMALILTLLLWTPFGEAIGGMKVNLNLFGLRFQPSEIAKYLIVIFIAAFFYRYASKIVKYSDRGNATLFKRKIMVLFGGLLGLGVLLCLYLFLGDMGPALVLGVSFVLLYSIVKSKTDLSGLTERNKLGRIFTSDFAMLVYGVLSFALMLAIGRNMGQWGMGFFCLAWFVGWVIFGIARRKQVFESAMFMNLIIAAFIFGGSILKQIPIESLQSAGERLEDRREMSVNTWGNLGITEGEAQDAGVNDQVVQGLWGLATGGATGQGLGKGNPNLIPAFHTDMVLASIGEQVGWIGLLVIVVCLALLLRQCVVVGFRSGNTFVFYLTTGIAIVTGVQFMVIALGSTGIIPLTGVTVPFLSFGKVSMILNLAAFGVVLSLSRKTSEADGAQRKNMESYNYTIALSSLLYSALAVFVLAVFLNYAVWERNGTLTRPVFVNNVDGAPVIEYNPRIALLMKQLHAGNIYDRSGRLLATNDKSTIAIGDYESYGVNAVDLSTTLKKRSLRYYPFGNHLLFMLGDYNTGVPFAYYKNNPIGYLAESQHLAALRGFDNILYDGNEEPVKVNLSSAGYQGNAFLPADTLHREGVVLRDYSAIVGCLKDHYRIARWNARREKRDITLTVDAALQTRMQNAIASHVAERLQGEAWNKLRVSVVVLNSANGELLTSANYPLPNQDTLLNAPNVYDEKDRHELAYTDRDLGLTYQTMPGSTAKVMSALAGFQKMGTGAAKLSYYIDERETVEPPTDEPNYQRDRHNTSMEEAIRLSSNNYFINLVNDQELYANLDSIYRAVGIRMPYRWEDNKLVGRSMTPYFFEPDYNDGITAEKYRNGILHIGKENVRTYRDYIEKRTRERVFEQMSGYHNGHDWNRMAWAWGQYDMGASPLNMARIAAIVANEGRLVETRFILRGNRTLEVPKKPGSVQIVSPAAASVLCGYMQNESKKHRDNTSLRAAFPADMGGKTGTPERELWRRTNRIDRNGNPQMETVKRNDGWYMFFVDSPKEGAPLAVAVRMERLPEAKGNTSRRAVELTDKVVLAVLREMNYITD